MNLKFFAIMLLLIAAACPVNADNEAIHSLAERLGFSASDKVLIINTDDAGLSYSTNKAVIESMENGLVTSASLMVPCSWFPHIADYAKAHPALDFGIHITLTSEWKGYRWSPMADDRNDIRGLTDQLGYFWSSIEKFYQHATPEEAENEAREQILTAHTAGINISHLDSHMGTMFMDAKYFAVYIKLAKEFDLPLRMPTQGFLESKGLVYFRTQLAKDGILCPDFLMFGVNLKQEQVKESWKHILNSLQPGVTEVLLHPALMTEEMLAITGEQGFTNWRIRSAEYELFTKDAEIRELLKTLGIKRIGYRTIRDLQRRERAAKPQVR